MAGLSNLAAIGPLGDDRPSIPLDHWSVPFGARTGVGSQVPLPMLLRSVKPTGKCPREVWGRLSRERLAGDRVHMHGVVAARCSRAALLAARPDLTGKSAEHCWSRSEPGNVSVLLAVVLSLPQVHQRSIRDMRPAPIDAQLHRGGSWLTCVTGRARQGGTRAAVARLGAGGR